MPLGLPVALALAAQTAPAEAAAGPADQAATLASTEVCRPTRPGADTREIVICGERPQGYRIDPDILTVRKMKRSGGRPVRPGPDGTRDNSVCAVGAFGCPIAGVNLLAAAATAVEMAKRLAEGKEIGSMFITDPQPNEYQMYVMARQAREAKELEEKAKAVAKAK